MSPEADLHLQGPADRTATLLRQELAEALRTGALVVRVHADDHPDVELDVLRSLDAARRVLGARGGTLVLLGASARAQARLRVHGLDAVLPPPAAVYPDASREERSPARS